MWEEDLAGGMSESLQSYAPNLNLQSGEVGNSER